jgi:hypothetical protein
MMRMDRKRLSLSHRAIKAMNSLAQDREHNHRKQFCGSKRGLKKTRESARRQTFLRCTLALRCSPQRKPDG